MGDQFQNDCNNLFSCYDLHAKCDFDLFADVLYESKSCLNVLDGDDWNGSIEAMNDKHYSACFWLSVCFNLSGEINDFDCESRVESHV